MSTPWYDSDEPRRWFWGITRWVVGLLVLSLSITLLGWAFGVWTAPWKGRGDAYKQQQSGDNRIFAQQQFHDLYQDFQATLAKIPIYNDQAKANPNDTAVQTNLTGLVAHCTDVAAQYNAAASKYLTKDFRDANLPPNIPPSQCRPN